MIEFESRISSATEFYQANYVPLISPLGLQHGKRITLGRKDDRICRFCKRNDTEVSFGMDAHVIPLSLGNKVLFSNYECNDCNQFFGGGIENDLGNWSKPHRTLARIRGKKGVPTIKNAGSEQGWRIEYDVDGFKFTEFGDEPHFVIDEENKKVSFQLQRDPYTPVAVFKALVCIGLTIMPEANLCNFAEALSWIRENDHSKSAVVECPILSTFVPGPMPNDLIFVALMQRHESVTDLPFAFMVLSYGNNVLQVFLPCPKQDRAIERRTLTIPPFPRPYGPDHKRYGYPRTAIWNLCGREEVRGETFPHEFGFDSMEAKDSKQPNAL